MNKNASASNNNSGDLAMAEMVKCPVCGREVPAPNMRIHQVTACGGGRFRHFGTVPPSERDNSTDSSNTNHGELVPAPVIDLFGSPTSHNSNAAVALPVQSQRSAHDNNDDHPLANGTQRNKERPRQADDVVRHTSQVVNLADSDDDEVEDVTESEWACPRCTLRNSMGSSVCDACQYTNNAHRNNTLQPQRRQTDELRQADAVQTERLIYDDIHEDEDEDYRMAVQQSPAALTNTPRSLYSFYPSSGTPSSATIVGGGALVGSLVGAAGAALRGRSLGSAVLEGAFSGAIGGALMDNVLRDVYPPSSRSTTAASPLTVASQGQSTVVNNSAAPNAIFLQQRPSDGVRMQPRQSIRVLRRPDRQGGYTTTTMYIGGGGPATFTDGNPMVHMLLRSMLMSPAAAGGAMRDGGGVENMSYERLLEIFGDGSENRGADPNVIQSLPTNTIQNLDKDLPKDQNKCSICLEDFCVGEERKTLPCWHGFHTNCVDRWLTRNGCCPICKFNLNESSH